MAKQRAQDSFVARIWLEDGGNGDSMWRGHIRHIQSEQEAYFRDLRAMSEFLEQVSGVPGPGIVGLVHESTDGPSARVPSGRKR